MEKLGDKIRRLILEKYPTIKEFYDILIKLNPKSPISRFTLTRILKNRAIVQERTLTQIATALVVTNSYLREGTEQETLKASNEEASYSFNEKAHIKVLEKNLPFVIEQLILKKDGRTDIEQDSPDKTESLKWIYVLIGKIKIIVKENPKEKQYSLHKSQKLSFNAKLPHYIENLSSGTSICLIIHYPAINNIFYAP